MSGIGSRGGMRCTTDMQALDVRALGREGLLRAGTYSTWHLSSRSAIAIEAEDDKVLLLYQKRSLEDGAWVTVRCMVMLERTPCNFGGSRVWWRCPASGCGRRVAVLHGGRTFACRRCHGLAYLSQRIKTSERAAKQLNNVRRRLRWTPGFMNPNGGKPSGMHWSTFWRLYAHHNELQERALDNFGAQLGALNARLQRTKAR